MLRRRTNRRRYGAKRRTRTYRRTSTNYRRRRVTRRPMMTRKRILNITSIKKHDNMLTSYRPIGQAVPTRATGLTTGTGFASLFMPSARALSQVDSGESHRQRQTIYARGYKENVAINISGGGGWKWRRIVFTLKSNILYNQTGDSVPYYDEGTSSAGSMERVINLVGGTQFARLREILFDGTEGVDWQDSYIAKVDTSRVTLISDKTTLFNPGNESGQARNFKFWYPLNKNLMYEDDESGSSVATSYTSVESKIGMGDLYVFDLCNLQYPSQAARIGSR